MIFIDFVHRKKAGKQNIRRSKIDNMLRLDPVFEFRTLYEHQDYTHGVLHLHAHLLTLVMELNVSDALTFLFSRLFCIEFVHGIVLITKTIFVATIMNDDATCFFIPASLISQEEL